MCAESWCHNSTTFASPWTHRLCVSAAAVSDLSKVNTFVRVVSSDGSERHMGLTFVSRMGNARSPYPFTARPSLLTQSCFESVASDRNRH